MACNWPNGECACYSIEAEGNAGPDNQGRVWMHCESGLNLSKLSMGRFLNFCLSNKIEIGDIYAFDPSYPRSQVLASVRIRPDQFEEFETQTGGVLRTPPVPALS